MQKNKTEIGKLHTLDLPEDFPVLHYNCEKKRKTAEDMQYHDHFEFGLCLEGQGIFFIGNQMVPFAQGNISIVPPGFPHFVQSLDSHPSKWLFIAVDRSVSDWPDDISSNIIFDHSMEQIMQIIAEELDKKAGNYKSVVRSLIDILFTMSGRVSNDMPSFFNYGKELSAVYPAIEYITNNYTEEISVEKLADICSLSMTHFRRRFRSVMGTTPLRYILIVRLRMASVLLKRTNRKISDIALDVGYNTLSSFNRHFKERYNMSPKDYRASSAEL